MYSSVCEHTGAQWWTALTLLHAFVVPRGWALILDWLWLICIDFNKSHCLLFWFKYNRQALQLIFVCAISIQDSVLVYFNNSQLFTQAHKELTLVSTLCCLLAERLHSVVTHFAEITVRRERAPPYFLPPSYSIGFPSTISATRGRMVLQ